MKKILSSGALNSDVMLREEAHEIEHISNDDVVDWDITEPQSELAANLRLTALMLLFMLVNFAFFAGISASFDDNSEMDSMHLLFGFVASVLTLPSYGVALHNNHELRQELSNSNAGGRQVELLRRSLPGSAYQMLSDGNFGLNLDQMSRRLPNFLQQLRGSVRPHNLLQSFGPPLLSMGVVAGVASGSMHHGAGQTVALSTLAAVTNFAELLTLRMDASVVSIRWVLAHNSAISNSQVGDGDVSRMDNQSHGGLRSGDRAGEDFSEL